jgi:peptidoglycan hydrolase CwlO-like protein
MKKLTKQQIEARDMLGIAINDAVAEANEAIDAFNAALDEKRGDIESAIAALNAKLEEARNWRDEIVSDQDAYYSERSDKWHESEAGENFEAWKQEFENAELDDVEIELPESIEHVDSDVADTLDGLPESVS